MIKKITALSGLMVPVAVMGGMLAGWMSLRPSTRNYIVHLVKQVPSLPYRYFI